MNKLRLAYFDDWGSQSQVMIFSGNEDVVRKLEVIFRSLSQRKITEIKISDLDFVEAFHGINLEACLFTADQGLTRKGNSNSFVWILPEQKWGSFADLISIFQGGQSGHHYLDSDSIDSIEVMVSVGEYSDNWIGWKTADGSEIGM